MSDTALLAQLIGQAGEEGAEAGARRALARLGLEDAGAGKDMAELRELLAAWRDAKRSVVKEVVAWGVRLVLALVLVGLAVKLGFWGWVK